MSELGEGELIGISRHCYDCGLEKDLSKFGKDKTRKLGRKYQCKECRREENQRNQQRNREYMRNYYQQTKDAQRPQRKKWAQKNREKQREHHRRWREKNKEKIAAWAKEWRENNRESARSAIRAYRARKRSAEGIHTARDIEDLYDEQEGLCAYCECVLLTSNTHVDHKTPLSRGGSNWPTNLALACGPCNQSKGNKTCEEFMAVKVKGHTKSRSRAAIGNRRVDSLAHHACQKMKKLNKKEVSTC